jgi:glucose-6-phosphate 1-dehydrogenase
MSALVEARRIGSEDRLGTVSSAELAPNPLLPGLERLPVDPTTLVIFGSTGDLCRRKLLPALYNLAHEGALPERFHLLAVSRSDRADGEFRDQAIESIRTHSRRAPDEEIVRALCKQVKYIGGSFEDPSVFERLEHQLQLFDERAGQPLNRVFYLSTAPDLFGTIVEALGRRGMNKPAGAPVRVVIEKPFGSSLAQARELNRRMLAVFEESQVFRVDHYLGKETVQNLLAFRFANTLFEPLWNRNYIEQVQITAAEEIGIGSRAGYYEHAGALRDLVQNHMLQLLCLLCMEPPVDFSADAVRNEKVKVLESIRPPVPDRVEQVTVRGQYAQGAAGGEVVPGYAQEGGVRDGSPTETYAALRLEVQSWRWSGVPFYLRTGKRLARKVTEIAVQLRPVPHLALRQEGSIGVQPNQLILRLEPNEGVSLLLGAKIPGTRMGIQPVSMEFRYGTSFLSESPDAYERLLLDAMRGDATLFTRDDEVEAQWRICDPIISHWQQSTTVPATYAAGSQGPAEADRVLVGDHRWRAI